MDSQKIPTDLLARAYLDMLATEAGTNSSPLLRSGNPDDPIERLIDDLSRPPESAGRTSIRADLAAAAVLVARAIESVNGLTRDLRRGCPVVSLATHRAEVVSLVKQVLEACAFGSEAKVLDERTFDRGYTHPVLLLARDGTSKDAKAERGNDTVASALHARAPIFGIAPDPRRHLARDLLRAAEHHLSLSQLDASAIALVIEAVTGRPPSVTVDEQLVRAVDISDLALSVRSEDVLPKVDLMPAALAALGKTGADIEAWVRRAKSRARRAKQDLVFDDLLHEIRSGREGLPESLRRTCSVHEAGHLIVGVALAVFEPQALTLLDDGGATRVELSRANSQTQNGIENFITALLSGRASEEIILGSSQATAGAGIGEQSDFSRATAAAIDLELRFGFGVIGLARFSDRATEMLLQDPSIVSLITKRLDRCHTRARELIAANRQTVEAVARLLEQTGYLDRAAIDELLKRYPVRNVATDNGALK